MFFLSGKINKEKEFMQLDLLPSAYYESADLLQEAIYNVPVLLHKTEIVKQNVLDESVFVLFNSQFISEEEAIAILNRLASGNVSEVVNQEEFFLDAKLKKELAIEETIFWDVLNNYAIIFGKENLAKFVSNLEYMWWSRGGLMPAEEIKKVLNQREDIPLKTKIKRLKN